MNHLIIGLGGTGERVICALRKIVFQEFGDVDPAFDTRTRVKYLYFDSHDPVRKKNEADKWLVLGRSVELSEESKLFVAGDQVNAQIQNAVNNPGVRPWLGARENYASILQGQAGGQGAAQKRRLGRVLFATKIDDFEKRINSLVKKMQEGHGYAGRGDGGCVFHVIAGLAGGTGSGSVVDAVALLRSAYTDVKSYPIMVYALLPEVNSSWESEDKLYLANGYAALTELSALHTGKWVPHDLRGQIRRPHEAGDEQYRHPADAVRAPFNVCYLITNENELGERVRVDTEIPEMIANYLYQRVYFAAASGASAATEAFNRVETRENPADDFESLDVNTRDSPNKIPSIPLRSRRFASFGIKRVLVPENEIQEHLAYSFAEQACAQLLSNHWSDDRGFIGQDRAGDMREYVSLKENLERWRLTDEYLTLSKPITDRDGKAQTWKPFEEEWKLLGPRFLQLAKEKEKSTWLTELERHYIDRYEKNFRAFGVARFFEIVRDGKELNERARAIKDRVENDALERVINGVWSLSEARLCIAALVGTVRQRAEKELAVSVQIQGQVAEAATREVESNKAKWVNLGPLSKIFGKSEQIVEGQQLCQERRYLALTRQAGYQYAIQLARFVLAELEELRTQVEQFENTVRRTFDKAREEAAARCADGQAIDPKQSTIRFYDKKAVDELRHELLTDKDIQQAQCQVFRTLIKERLGSDSTFASLNAQFGTGGEQQQGSSKLKQMLERTCGDASISAHDQATKRDSGRRLLGVSILEKLKARYPSGSDELKSFANELIQSASLCIKLSVSELNKKDGPGIRSEAKYYDYCIVLHPSSDPNEKYLGEFMEACRAHYAGNELTASAVKSQPGGRPRTNGITIVRVTTNYAARCFEHVASLRQQYLDRVGDPKRGAWFEQMLHLEGTGRTFPPLTVQSPDETRDAIAAHLLVAKAAGWLSFDVDSEQWRFLQGANEFTGQWIGLGKDLPAAMEELRDYRKAEAVSALVEGKLAALSRDDRRLTHENIIKEAGALSKERKLRDSDPLYIRLKKAVSESRAVLGIQE